MIGIGLSLSLLLLLLLVVLFLTVTIILCFTGHRKLLGTTLLRALTPSLVAIPLIFTILAAVSYQREVHQVSQTVYERISPEFAAGMTRVERDNAAFLHKTFRELLEQAPEQLPNPHTRTSTY